MHKFEPESEKIFNQWKKAPVKIIQSVKIILYEWHNLY